MRIHTDSLTPSDFSEAARIAVREISEALGIPYPFLAKTVQTLTGAGLFRSMRGPTGGVG